MKIGLIVTVLNEDKTIKKFLDSISLQTRIPDEIVIVDGGSTDKTCDSIENHSLFKDGSLKLYKIRGNISKGRNFAIRKIKSEIVAISDAGCILDKNWLKNLIKNFTKDIDVVAGFYKGHPKSNFEKNLIPYVLVMSDKVSDDFLPASRSMAIRKKTFLDLGGFREDLDHGEDYDFSKRLKKNNISIKFAKDAIVRWVPRENLYDALKMFYRYAYGDIKALNFRRKVLLIFLRYLFVILSVFAARFISIYFQIILVLIYFSLYSSWAVFKNFKYVKNSSAYFYLPILQLTSDIAVMTGSVVSLTKSFTEILRNSKILTGLIFLFILMEISLINWGLPNINHPFTYHMDEWHQLQSIRNLFINLTPNMEGSANGPIFHFALSGFFVVVIYVLGLVDPFLINSSFTNLDAQNNLFIYLRLSTLIFSLLSLCLLIIILKKYLNVKNLLVPVVLFLFSPLWISLSNYFKYDIALVFWILLSCLLFFRFRNNPTLQNYLMGSVPVSFAVATKISALPLVLIYLLAFIFYKKNRIRNIHFPLFGFVGFLVIFLFIGIPDLLIGRGNYYEYFYSNLVTNPNLTSNYILGMPYWIYLFTNQIPTLFGLVLCGSFVVSIVLFLKSFRQNAPSKLKDGAFLIISFIIFSLSLIPLKLFIINRSLVLLPFMTLFIGLIFGRIKSKIPFYLVFALLLVHVIQGFSWILTKYNDPRQTSSKWIKENVDYGSVIGIENVPIYQFLPDVVLKGYYENLDEKKQYKYEIIESTTNDLPEYIVVTNADIDMKYLIKSPKKELIERLSKSNYKLVKSFNSNLSLNKIFNTRLDFFISLLSPTPNIYIYKKIK